MQDCGRLGRPFILLRRPRPTGFQVRFSLPPDFDVIEKVIKGCEELKAKDMPEADALLLFNCAGRPLSLGPDDQ